MSALTAGYRDELLDPLRFVKFFATTKHGSQLYSGVPYTHHLAEVAAVVRRFHYDEKLGYTGDRDLLAAAWLHDVMEDTDTKYKEVAEMFGKRIADLVSAVTDEKGPNRQVRHALTYPKTRACPGAVTLKLADRIANVERGGLLGDMYRKEYEDFRRALFTEGENVEMCPHLDKLMEWPRQ